MNMILKLALGTILGISLLFNCSNEELTNGLSDTYLSNLEISPEITLSPAFSPNVFNYDGNYQYYPKSTFIKPTAQNNLATITVNGESVASGTGIQVYLPGPTQGVITIIVKSPSSEHTPNYTITVKM